MGYIYISIVVLSILGWVKSFDTLNEGVTHIHQSQLSFVFTEHRSWLRHMVPGKHCWLTGINRKLSQNQMAHRWDPELQLGLMFIPPNIWQYKIGFHPYPNGSCSTWGTSADVFRPYNPEPCRRVRSPIHRGDVYRVLRALDLPGYMTSHVDMTLATGRTWEDASADDRLQRKPGCVVVHDLEPDWAMHRRK